MDTNQKIEQLKRMIAQNEEQIRWLKKLVEELENDDGKPHTAPRSKNPGHGLPLTEREYFIPPVTPEKMCEGVLVVMERMEKSIEQVPLNALIQELNTKYGARKVDIVEAVKKLIKDGELSEPSNNKLKLLR